MELTIFSFITAILWYCLFSAIFLILMRSDKFIQSYSVYIPIALALLGVLRCVVPINFLTGKLITVGGFYRKVRDFLWIHLFSFTGLEINVASILFVIWCVGILVSIAIYLHKQRKFSRWISSLPQSENAFLCNLAKSIIGENVCVLTSDVVTSPMITGFKTPILIMPNTEYPKEYYEPILRHEAVHFKNGDIWSKLILNILSCFLWWNPLAYLIKNNVDHSLELKCDADVLADMTHDQRVEYFEMILNIHKLSRKKQSQNAVGLVSARSDRQLKQRFNVGLQQSKKRSKGFSIIAITILVAVFVFSYTFVVQAGSSPSQEEIEEGGLFQIDTKTSYLVDNHDGTYNLYMNGEDMGILEDISQPPFSEMEIK